MLKINTTRTRNLDAICIQHYQGLKETIEESINKNLSDNPLLKAFLTHNLEEILTGKPALLKKLAQELPHTEDNPNKILNTIFNYTKFKTKKRQGYDAYTLAKRLNFNTCPYCNRNYTVTVIKEKEKIVRPDFDHFFPKSEYPLLALSFYNLIPCCSICNSTLKGQTEVYLETHLHPYLEGFDNTMEFHYLPQNTASALGVEADFILSFIEHTQGDSDKLEKCKRNAELFKLEPIYQESHSEEVAAIIRKHDISNGTYLQTLADAFPQIGDLNELYRLAFGQYFAEDDFEKRPISKLTRDIFNSLSFIHPYTLP